MSDETTAEQANIETRRVERVYSVLARVYDHCFDWALGTGRREAIRRLPIRPGDRVLEVGVGTGLSLPYYPRDCRLTGIDISEPMLDQARERAERLALGEPSLRLMDARRLAFSDASFDHVVAPYVISVVPEPERVMTEISRVCKPGGTVMVVNQFLSTNRFLRGFDRMLTPLTRWIGFRMDLPMDSVTRSPGLRVVGARRVNAFGLWHLLEMRKEP